VSHHDAVIDLPQGIADDIVSANRILAHEQILDAYGHVSARHPGNPEHFVMARARSPEYVEASDLLELDLEGNVLSSTTAVPYVERFIHAAIYAARPDAQAICHNHALSVLPFSISKSAPLTWTINASRLFNDGVAIWDIADEFGTETDLLVRSIDQGRSLARSLAASAIVLMRGHGAVVVASSLRRLVRACLDMDRAARVQLDLLALGHVVGPTDAEKSAPMGLPAGLKEDDREWEHLSHRAKVAR
jgi:ribulose-5-phosphate 4-epimerase/fuculose-1-phosphate aldolase